MKNETYGISQIYKNEGREWAKYVVTSRAIPHIIDGLKPSQRFYLYSSIKNSKNEFKKVAAIGGVVSECLVGSSKILMSDGNTITIEELYEMGEYEVELKSIDSNLNIVDDVGFDIVEKKKVSDTIVLNFDDGKEIECTHDHLIGVYSNGEIIYKKAIDIDWDDEIITL